MFNFFKKYFKFKNMDSKDTENNEITTDNLRRGNPMLSDDRLLIGRNKYGVSFIEDHLLLSGSDEANNLKILNELDVKYVLSVFDDDLSNKSKSIVYMKISVDDYYLQNLITHFPESNKFISNAVDSAQNVLVHCHAGISRSSTMVLAYLMNKKKMPYESALEFVRKNRRVCPNEGFVEQLKLYEEMGFSLNGNNRKLRQHVIKTVLDIEIWERRTNKIEEYFKVREDIDNATENLDLGKKCLCVKCGHHLFNEIHILDSNIAGIEVKDPKLICEWTYIEPLKWMTELTKGFEIQSNENHIKCPNCGEGVVEFQRQFMQYWCECWKHLNMSGRCLRFRVGKANYKLESNLIEFN